MTSVPELWGFVNNVKLMFFFHLLLVVIIMLVGHAVAKIAKELLR